MKITIDKAGRVVIPAAIRERVGLKAGTELEVLTDDIAIHLIPTGPEPEIQHRGRRKIAKPTSTPLSTRNLCVFFNEYS